MRLIRQTEATECGLACLAMIADHYGYRTDLASLRRRFPVSLKGMSMDHLVRHASALGLAARPVRLELDDLDQLTCPCILHWNLQHFVVLEKVRRTWRGVVQVVILDPAIGRRVLSLAAVSRSFTGVAMEMQPTPAFERRDPPKRIVVAELAGKVIGLRRAVVQILALALALEILTLASPLFNQFVIDQVVVSGDRELLKVLVIAFGLLLATQTALSVARGLFLMRWNLELGLQWSIRVFAHLIRLPAGYFERRQLGDVVSRFGSTGAIQGILSSLLVENALDGLMAILALAMMLSYSGGLTAVVMAGAGTYALLRWRFYTPLREATQERLLLAAKESSHFIESIQAIIPIKLFGREPERMMRWQNLKVDVVNRDIRTQRLDIGFRACSNTLFGLQTVGLFYLGADLILSNSLTVGMLTAFGSYASTFSSRMFKLIDMVVNIRMLSVHTERLADIALEPVEEAGAHRTDTDRLVASITLRNVRYRYGEGEPWIIDGVDLHIPSGQSVALVGPSGCGKTTLCKIILGLLPPTEGEVLVDNIPIRQLGLANYRELVGTVMQDDVLLSGSIIDNIVFYDAPGDLEHAFECARIAAIHDDIVAMPMGYHTVIGDLGSSLSGGQKQRILLARALYKRPRILALDEATSHLDVNNERRVSQAIHQLQLTRIIVAHRPETIQSAQRIVAMDGGRIVEQRAQALVTVVDGPETAAL
jgi:ATP-binding cassette subfamily B protein RaxB